MKRFIIATLLITIGSIVELQAANSHSVHMANGIKIGEVTQDTAIIWTRLTKAPEANLTGISFPDYKLKKEMETDPEVKKVLGNNRLEDMVGSVAGAEGMVRLIYWPKADVTAKKSTGWVPVNAKTDCVAQFPLVNLMSGTDYGIRVVGRSNDDQTASVTIDSTFKTLPLIGITASVNFTVVTGQRHNTIDDKKNGQKIYSVMKKLKPDFFVHTGDIEYYDKPGPYGASIELARFKWNRLYAMPFLRDFHNTIPSYFIKDDHDTVKNDAWPGQSYGELTWEQGLAVFREQVPMGKKTYRIIRYGKDLQVWMVEGRDFRSPNTMIDGPDKTIWGEEQKQWFYRTVNESEATFRILISPTPIVGPDRLPMGSGMLTKADNHANRGFSYEGNEIRDFIGQQKNMFVICGDRHWQYTSVDLKTGVREYSTGPTTDKHAGGYFAILSLFDKLMAKRATRLNFLKIKGGFLSVRIYRKNETPTIIFNHHDVDGNIVNSDRYRYNPKDSMAEAVVIGQSSIYPALLQLLGVIVVVILLIYLITWLIRKVIYRIRS